jgi:copper chaperone CopZ
MKTLKIFIVLLSLSYAANAQFTKAELQVSGLTCSMCSKATEKSLRTLNFVGDIKADLNKNIFLITFKKDARVDIGLISKKVENAGFFVNSLKATFDFDNVKLENNSFSYDGDTFYVLNPSSQPLSGTQTITVVDKGFAPPSVYKKYKTAADSKGYHVVI